MHAHCLHLRTLYIRIFLSTFTNPALAINRYHSIRKLVLLRIFLQYQTADRSAKIKTKRSPKCSKIGNIFLSYMLYFNITLKHLHF